MAEAGQDRRNDMTLKDIARQAGVSVTTVSRVLNDSSNTFASEKVRQRIWEIVQKTGYSPNPNARNLKMGNVSGKRKPSMAIACFLARSRTPDENPFFAQITRAIEQAALQFGYAIPYYFTQLDNANQTTLNRILDTEVDGAIALGRFSSAKVAQSLSSHYKNIVYTGLVGAANDWDQVICDGYEAAKAAMRYLIDAGHRHIAFVGETERECRYQGYLEALNEAKIPIIPSLTSSCATHGVEGYRHTRLLLEKAQVTPTAILCTNDNTALPALKCLLEMGYSVPKDISIMGIDDIMMSSMVSPMLSTVHVPIPELGQIAIKTLISRINKEHTLPMKIVLPYQLVIRESTCKLR
jgi:DNA-binding LacI/PurR family transcriptional regulator